MPKAQAQLIAHFGEWDVRDRAVRCYERFAPLAERQREALPLEIIADLVGEGLWSLEALYLEPSTEPTGAQRSAHAHNLRTLLGCLEDAGEAARSIPGQPQG